METQTLAFIIGFFCLSFLCAIVYFLFTKKKETAKISEGNKRVAALYNEPNIAKVALWIHLESVNGEPFDNSRCYYVKVKSNMTGLNMTTEVALFEPGLYTFVVNSREYSGASINVAIDPGRTYQLGANEDGPYFIPDPDEQRYNMQC